MQNNTKNGQNCIKLQSIAKTCTKLKNNVEKCVKMHKNA